jgi:hypothetical protein
VIIAPIPGAVEAGATVEIDAAAVVVVAEIDAVAAAEEIDVAAAAAAGHRRGEPGRPQGYAPTL